MSIHFLESYGFKEDLDHRILLELLKPIHLRQSTLIHE